MSDPIIDIRGVEKIYAGGFQALAGVDLQIRRGEILSLLGPNGAGKTTLIGVVCGLVTMTGGTVTVDGADVVADYRRARSRIGLVPQELTTDAFETVWDTVSFSRGLFGKKSDPARIERILRDLSLWEKRTSQLMTLSGGMKRRVMIAKALSHEPEILFLDEPSAGVDVELRKGMWSIVRRLREAGVTIILTTHYIEEAEEIADRVAVIDKGRILLVDEKSALMGRLGQKRLEVDLETPLGAAPAALAAFDLKLAENGARLIYHYAASSAADADVNGAARGPGGGVEPLLRALLEAGLRFKDVRTAQSTLEEIFVDLVRGRKGGGDGERLEG